MHKFNGNGTLAHGGGNALDRTVTHVAGYLLADGHSPCELMSPAPVRITRIR